MPHSIIHTAPPPDRFDFSGGKGLIRPNKNLIASTTLDIMRGQGMKYAHAITDARQGVEGDLEKSKRQIKRYKETVLYLLSSPVALAASSNRDTLLAVLLLPWENGVVHADGRS